MSVRQLGSTNDFFKKRNSGNQYDEVEIAKEIVNKAERDTLVSTFAVVVSSTSEEVVCVPFPIREGSKPVRITAYNLTGKSFESGSIAFIVFTDRDYRKNISSASLDENTIGSTDDTRLHSSMYGVCIGPSSASRGEKGDKGDKGDTGPQGPKGDKGDPGQDGRDGRDGTAVYG